MALGDFRAARILRVCDNWLIQHGFSLYTLRKVLLCELALGAALFFVSFLLLVIPSTRPWGLWLFWFSVGIFIESVNFIILVISGQRLIKAVMGDGEIGNAAVTAAIMSIMLKLIITALLFCALVLVFNAPLAALLAGFTLPLIIVLFFGFLHAGQK